MREDSLAKGTVYLPLVDLPLCLGLNLHTDLSKMKGRRGGVLCMHFPVCKWQLELLSSVSSRLFFNRADEENHMKRKKDLLVCKCRISHESGVTP